MQKTQFGQKRPKNLKRKLAGIMSAVIALAIILTGTFAWSAVSQRATNPLEDITLSGGRIHDHFDGANKDVFAENFGTNPLFVRIQLLEFMEVNGLIFGEDAVRNQPHTWSVHTPYNNNPAMNDNAEHGSFRDYVTWNIGGSTWFMPTFNQRTYADRRLETDTSGYGIDWAASPGNVGVGDPTQTAEWQRWTGPVGGPYVATGTFNDGRPNFWQDGDSAYEYLYYTEINVVTGNATNHVSTDRVRHYAQETNNAVVMTMEQWQDAGRNPGNFWVIDADGWAYWAAPLMPGEATGLLLSGINVTPPQGSWFYAIHVVGEFADASGLEDWEDSDFGAPSPDAEELLNIIRGITPQAPPEEPNAGNTEIGGFFEDDAGVYWQVLYRLPNGDTLIISRFALGNGAPNAPHVHGNLPWNDVNANGFVSWNFNGPVNNRLATLWGQIGSDIREIALVPNIPTDRRTTQGNWPAANSAEWLGQGTLGAAGTGLTAPTAVGATTGRATAGTGGTGAMFHLSLAEAGRYFIGDAGAQPSRRVAGVGESVDGRTWALRSPGDTASSVFRAVAGVSSNGTRLGSGAASSGGWTIRPAMWVATSQLD